MRDGGWAGRNGGQEREEVEQVIEWERQHISATFPRGGG
jgi:hypothetical protein